MGDLWQANQQAFYLLLSGDAELWTIIGISFRVSLWALLIAAPAAMLLAFAMARLHFPGRRLLIATFHTLMALPAVVVGLTVYMLLARNGLLGDLRWLFTQKAMVIGQIVLCFPLLVSISHATLREADQRVWETALTLGSTRWHAMLTLMHEVRYGLMAALIAAFGRIIAEVGSSMMVGGNIAHHTRNIPTAIALETSKGEFAQGIALGFVLLFLALTLNFALNLVQSRSDKVS